MTSTSEPQLPSISAILARFLIGIGVYGGLLFLSAGTWNYWPAWIFLAAIFLPMMGVIPYLYRNHPKLLIRRMKMKEKESEQKWLVGLMALAWIGGLIVAGLDFRFGWSLISIPWVIFGNLLVTISYMLIVWVFTVNEYAARTVEVEVGQKVISTGPYSVVRHPMYSFMLLLSVAMPLGLGSLWFLLVSATALPIALVFRILNEEKVLRNELEGYNAYCEKVRSRMIPYIW